MSKEAMKQALEALYLAVRIEPSDSIHECPEMFQGAITALRNELAKQEQGEHVVNNKFTRAWISLAELPGGMMQGPQGLFGPIPASTSCWITTSESERDRCLRRGVAMLQIYTTPQPAQKPWVGLTDADIKIIAPDVYGSFHYDDYKFARAVEAKLKEKNT